MGLMKNEITDMESWRRLSPPEDAMRQWKCTRSAMELARYFTRNLPELPEETQKAIAHSGEPTGQAFSWAAEYVTSLPGHGEGRHHDLFLFGETICAGVEAKADEPFDKTLDEWLEAGEKNADKGTNRKARLNGLCRIVFDTEYKEEYSGLRYQLLSALAGSILEAKNRKVEKAMLMILSFDIHNPNKPRRQLNPDNVGRNNRDFDAFVKAVGFSDETGKTGSDALEYVGRKTVNDVESFIVKATIRDEIRCDTCPYRSCHERVH